MSEPESGMTIRVLLVEDDEDDYTLTREALRLWDGIEFDLTRADTLAAALETLNSTIPDAVLLDFTLPDADGWTALTRLREKCPDVPVLFLTGRAEEAMGEEAFRRGAQDYLVKGEVHASHLPRAVRHAVVRHRIEQALAESEARFRSLVETIEDWVWESDAAGVLRYSSPKVAGFLGVSPDRAVGRRLAELVPEAHSGRADAIFAEAAAARAPIVREECDAVDGAGRGVVMEINAAPVFDASGVLAGFRGVTRDITEPKRAREALGLYRDHLETLVQRRTRELSAANRELERQIAEKERAETGLREALTKVEEQEGRMRRFVADVSHELKTPVSSISYATDNLLHGVVGDLSARCREYLEMIREDSRRLGSTINDVLDLGRIDANTLALNRVKLPLASLAACAVEAVRVQAQAKRQVVSLFADGSHFAECDAGKMLRAVVNILQNSINYSPAGGAVEVRLDPTLTRDRMVVLHVVDDGIGIPPEHLGRVMDRFYRVGEHGSGTGLGLSLCKEIVERHGGRMEIESPPSGRTRGTAVRLYLPLASPPVVFALDGEDENRRLLREDLTPAGYRVQEFALGHELLKEMQIRRPDVLILDLMGASMDGIGVLGRVRAEPDWRLIPILPVVTRDVDETRRQILQGYMLAPLEKPWRREELLRRLSDAALLVTQ